ncbi:MAG: helix-turn-helix transcriptional regulator [Oscillospiraceae bacterium]|nr:helix-turn-helix transcriptional regulator [Oscillospiraceae bacterium]
MEKILPEIIEPKYMYFDSLPIIFGLRCTAHTSKFFNLCMHDCVELWYCLVGDAEHYVGGQIFRQTPGTCVIVPSFVPHFINVKKTEETPIFASIKVSDDALRKLGYDYFSYFNKRIYFEGKILPIYHKFSANLRTEANDIVHSISDEFSKHINMNFDRLFSLFVDFLQLLGGEKADSRPQKKRIERTETILNVTKYIHENHLKKITIEDLCEISYMSRSRLCEYFTEITGVSPMYYHRCFVLAYLRTNFLIRGRSMSEIVNEIEMYSKPQLCRAFKNHFGMTLTEYKKNQVFMLREDQETRNYRSDLDTLHEFFENQNTEVPVE